MKRNIILKLLLVAFVTTNCTKNSDDPSSNLFSVEGIVKGGQGPVAGVTVSLDKKLNWTSNTNKEGTFLIENVSEGMHDISIVKNYDSSFVERNYNIAVVTDTKLDTISLPSPLNLIKEGLRQPISKSYVTLSWNKSDAFDFREYKLYRHSTSGLDETTGTLIHVSTSKDDTTFTDSIPHSSTYFYRLFQMNSFGRLGGSNVLNVSVGEYVNNSLLELGTINERYLNENETLWFHFPAKKGEIYKITWEKREWQKEFVGDVSCYRANKTTAYFKNELVLIFTGSPKTIVAKDDEDVYIKFKGQVLPSKGKFKILVEHLPLTQSKEVGFNSQNSLSVQPGETHLFHINTIADSNYRIDLNSVKNYDAVYVKTTVFGQKQVNNYFYEEFTGNFEDPKMLDFKSLESEPVYIIFTGGYWIYDADIKFVVTELE